MSDVLKTYANTILFEPWDKNPIDGITENAGESRLVRQTSYKQS